MATLLGTTIEIFTHYDATTTIKHTFTPYLSHIPTPFLPHNPPTIALWATKNHFQLLLPFSLSPRSLAENLLPLPAIPLHNTNAKGHPITVAAPQTAQYHPWCHYSDPSPPTIPRAFVVKLVIHSATITIPPFEQCHTNTSPQTMHLHYCSQLPASPLTLPSLKSHIYNKPPIPTHFVCNSPQTSFQRSHHPPPTKTHALYQYP